MCSVRKVFFSKRIECRQGKVSAYECSSCLVTPRGGGSFPHTHGLQGLRAAVSHISRLCPSLPPKHHNGCCFQPAKSKISVTDRTPDISDKVLLSQYKTRSEMLAREEEHAEIILVGHKYFGIFLLLSPRRVTRPFPRRYLRLAEREDKGRVIKRDRRELPFFLPFLQQ